MAQAGVILADDHEEFLSLVKRLIETEFDVLQTLTNGQTVVDEVERFQPNLVVLDITMPGVNGLEAAQQLKAAGTNAKIIFLTVHKDHDYLRSAIAVGALGYVVKDRMASDLIPAMHSALAGRMFVSASLGSETAE